VLPGGSERESGRGRKKKRKRRKRRKRRKKRKGGGKAVMVGQALQAPLLLKRNMQYSDKEQ